MSDVIRNQRGGIWYFGSEEIDEADKTKGTRGILTGGRPVMIFSDPPNGTNTCTCLVIPISTAASVQMSDNSEERAHQFFMIPIDMPRKGKCYLEVSSQFITTTNQLRGYVGQVSPELMHQIEAEQLRFCCINPEDHITTPTTENLAEMVAHYFKSPIGPGSQSDEGVECAKDCATCVSQTCTDRKVPKAKRSRKPKDAENQ
jgi:mRNA-degrading endonuclease toxin of MazEF toxin-antitoxin module